MLFLGEILEIVLLALIWLKLVELVDRVKEER